MTDDLVTAAERAWDSYMLAARKRAKMENDPNFSPNEKIAQQRHTDAAFRIFREAFAKLDHNDPPTARPHWKRWLVGAGQLARRLWPEREDRP